MDQLKKAELKKEFKKYLELNPDAQGKIRSLLTRRKYDGVVNRFLNKYDEVTAENINEFIKDVMETSNSFWVKYPFKPFLEMIKEPFMWSMVIKPRLKPKKRSGNYLDEDDLSSIIKNMEVPKFRLAATIQKETGCRASEVLALRGQDIIKDEKGDIIIRFWEMKTEKERRIPWNMEPIGSELLEMRTKPFLFLSRNKYESEEEKLKALRNIYRYYWGDIKQAAKKMGFPTFSTHDFRRVMTRIVFRATSNDLIATKDFMGHSSTETTVKYIGDMQSNKKEIIRKIHDDRSKT